MSDNKDKSTLLGQSDNKFIIALSQTDLNRINLLPEGSTIQINLGNEFDLLGDNKLVLSNDLIIDVLLINDKFIIDKENWYVFKN